MKRLCPLTLTAALLLGLLAGCSGAEVQSSSAPPADFTPVTEAVASTAPQPEEASVPETGSVASVTDADWDPSLPYGNGTEEDWDPEAIVAAVDTDANPIQFPLDEQETLSVWMSIPDMLPQDLPEGMAAHRTFMAMEELTNVKLDWTEVTTTLAATQFQLMIAGGDYTDMIFNASSMYNTGLAGAVEDDVFLPLND